MNRTFARSRAFKKHLLVVASMIVAVGVVSCGEKLEGGASCPLLCPQQTVTLRDTLIAPVALDTTRADFSPIGQEPVLLLMTRGDTFDTRAIFRFDSITPFYFKAAAPNDTVRITMVDSARLRLHIDTSTVTSGLGKPTAPVTIEAYDVGSTSDTAVADLLPFFVPARLLGSRTVDSLTDTLDVPIANDTVARRIAGGARLRIGLKLVSGTSAVIRIIPSTSAPATLLFKPSADTTLIAPLVSQTPVDSTEATLRVNLADFVIVAKGNAPLPANTIAVGGYPAKRTLLRFDLPSRIVDSATVVRASLVLHQIARPNGPGAADSVTIFPLIVTASPVITDVSRLFNLVLPRTPVESLRVRPMDAGERRLELISIVRIWRLTSPTTTQRSLVLEVARENRDVLEAVFASMEAADSLKPRLQLVYLPRQTLGLP